MRYLWDLEFWNTGEWQLIQEKLDDLDKAKVPWCPGRDNLFRALQLTSFERTRVVLLGQDPYPNPQHASGIAFGAGSSKDNSTGLPASLSNILVEYASDLHYPTNSIDTSLVKWAEEGVLMWNATPTCEAWKAGSHREWPWNHLTQEIIEKLNQKTIVYILLGKDAQEWKKFINLDMCEVVEASHPSPLSANKTSHPFLGSRIFSTANSKLVEMGIPPINWRL